MTGFLSKQPKQQKSPNKPKSDPKGTLDPNDLLPVVLADQTISQDKLEPVSEELMFIPLRALCLKIFEKIKESIPNASIVGDKLEVGSLTNAEKKILEEKTKEIIKENPNDNPIIQHLSKWRDKFLKFKKESIDRTRFISFSSQAREKVYQTSDQLDLGPDLDFISILLTLKKLDLIRYLQKLKQKLLEDPTQTVPDLLVWLEKILKGKGLVVASDEEILIQELNISIKDQKSNNWLGEIFKKAKKILKSQKSGELKRENFNDLNNLKKISKEMFKLIRKFKEIVEIDLKPDLFAKCEFMALFEKLSDLNLSSIIANTFDLKEEEFYLDSQELINLLEKINNICNKLDDHSKIETLLDEHDFKGCLVICLDFLQTKPPFSVEIFTNKLKEYFQQPTITEELRKYLVNALGEASMDMQEVEKQVVAISLAQQVYNEIFSKSPSLSRKLSGI